ncbi:hypothetical protein M068_3174 [Bacteroides fragilis str. J38-1]|nr:hypothetical protein M068_3174 [Bacteroides fragilis str. J38-1]
MCIFHQRDDGASRSVKVYCGKTKSAPEAAIARMTFEFKREGVLV